MNHPVLIVGGGIAGLTTALALQQLHIDFLVLEAVPEIKTVGAGISLAGNAMRVMKRLGLANAIKHNGHLISSMLIQDEHGSTLSVMDAAKLSSEYELDNVAIHRSALHQVLLKAISQNKILTNNKVTDYTEGDNFVEVVLQNGNRISGSCILVADGIHSSIRKKLLPQSQIRYSGYTCWRGIAENTWGIEKVAVEKWGTAGRFGYVPIGDNKVYWFACKNAPQKNEQMQTMTLAQLAENFRNYSHPVPEIIRQTPASELIWGDIIDLKPISRYAFNKVVLLGDAAHATTPNMGQGACMGIEDAWLIATLLQQHANNLTEAFRLFEAQRLKRTHYIVNTSYRLGKIAQWENRILTKLRNTAFRLVPASVNEKQVIKLLDIPVR